MNPTNWSARSARRAGKRRPPSATGSVYLERYLPNPRHIEIQLLGDAHGNIIHLGERECSIQRRHQKLIEEAPSPILTTGERAAMGEAAIQAARAVSYRGAGTVEFLYQSGDFFFLEMNTRLQVEHPVTELVTGIDIVDWQLRIASGEALDFSQEDVKQTGHAIECRITSEDPFSGFLPSTGVVTDLQPPTGPGVRWDGGICEGFEISLHYDPLLAKLIVHAPVRSMAIRRMARALDELAVSGVETSTPFHRRVMADPDFHGGELSIRYLDEHPELLGPGACDATLQAAAIAAAFLEDRDRRRGSPRTVSGGVTGRSKLVGVAHVGMAVERPVIYRVSVGGRVFEIDIFPGGVRVDGKQTHVDLSAPKGAAKHSLLVDGASHRIAARRSGRGRWSLQILNRHHEAEVLDERAQTIRAMSGMHSGPGSSGPSPVTAPMPGLVLKVEVDVDDVVAAGQGIVIVEAMKMENEPQSLGRRTRACGSRPRGRRRGQGSNPRRFRSSGGTERMKRDVRARTDSGIEVERIHGPAGEPGASGTFPFTRGIHPGMYRERVWTMRQYAGFGTAEETNARFRYLLERGQTGLSVAFDLPTQMGYDSDAPMAAGEVGRAGVAIDSLDDMRQLFAGIRLDEVSTSMTINSTAAILLGLYTALGDEQGIARNRLAGTVQNDVLKEYIARGTYIYPVDRSLRLVSDVIAFCSREMPKWNPISISGYHIREAGATAPQEVAFTFANGLAYVARAVAAGLDIDAFAPRLSFFFAAHNDLFEEIAKFRAARRLWAKLLRERFLASDRSCRLRFHAQTGGSTLTAQQPFNNVVRVTVQALAAVLGGTQSLHTNSYDEALALPTEASAKLALRTQQILAAESGVTRTADPLGGSHYVEALTDEIERLAREQIEKIDEIGGAPEAIGHMRDEIHREAYRFQLEVEDGVRPVVGVNVHSEEGESPRIGQPDYQTLEHGQTARLASFKTVRDGIEVRACLRRIEAAASGTENLLPPIIGAVKKGVTLGEISETLRETWGVYDN